MEADASTKAPRSGSSSRNTLHTIGPGVLPPGADSSNPDQRRWEFRMADQIGRGSFGAIYQGRDLGKRPCCFFHAGTHSLGFA